MEKICHIFDLESSLVKIDRKIWIINKKSPNEYLIKITESDFKLIKSGLFKSQNYHISYNGEDFYLSKEIYEKLRKVDKNISLKELGVSMREYLDKEIINNLDITILDDNINELKNTKDDFFVISSRLIEDKYEILNKKIEDILEKLGIHLNKIYYISQNVRNITSDITIYKKAIIILQNILGIKIDNYKLSNEINDDSYEKVCYYDNNTYVIESLKSINDILQSIYDDSSVETKELIKTRLESTPKLTIELNLTTNNSVNPFKKSIVDIDILIEDSINESIKRFKDFR